MKLLRGGIRMKEVGLSLVFAAGLVGCAVLTVDVDVYKGALVNEEHVQLHQLTALATAAKPMLIGLRNALEWPYTDGVPREGPQICPAHDHNWYEQGYVQQPFEAMPKSRWIMWRHEWPYQPSISVQDITCWKGFENLMAGRVNRILHLYENLGTEDLSFFAKKLLDAQAMSQSAESILKGGQGLDAARAVLIERGFKPKTELGSKLGTIKAEINTLIASSDKLGKILEMLTTVPVSDNGLEEIKTAIETIAVSSVKLNKLQDDLKTVSGLDDTRKRLLDALKNVMPKPEARNRILDNLKEKPISTEQLEKLRENIKGITPSCDELHRIQKELKLAPADELQEAYRTLLRFDLNGRAGLPFRKAGGVMDALAASEKEATLVGRKDRQDENAVEQELIKSWKGMESYRDKTEKIYERRLPFRAVWKLIAEAGGDSMLAKATNELFTPDANGKEAQKALTEWVRELAAAYWNSLETMHELWETSLRVLIQLDRLEQREPARHRAVLDRAIDVVAQLTSAHRIASALERVKSDGRCLGLDRALISGLSCDSEGSGKLDKKQATWTEDDVRANPDRYEVLLRRALSKTPADTAYFLLDLDQMEQSAVPVSEVGRLVKEVNAVNTKHIVRLGLNRSAVDQDGQDDYQQLVQGLSRGLAGGFERGRLLYGIHTLTETYLQAHDRATEMRTSPDTEERAKTKIDEEIHQRRLLDALVEFAEKVRFLANHEGLVSPPPTSGLILGGAEKFTRGLLGDRITDHSIYGVLGLGLAETKQQRYVRVLQAVGNSILFSANELREKDRHREEGQKKVAAEVMAAKSVYSPDPAKVITDLLTELEHDRQVSEIAIDEASARKNKVVADIGNSTVPKTGLYGEKDKAEGLLTQAEQNLNSYRKSLGTLEAIHGILTDDVMKQVKSQWSAGLPAPNDVAGFLNGTDGRSLKQKLEVVRQSLNGTLSQEEMKRWTVALQHVEAQETREAFEAYRVREGQLSLERSALFDAFVLHIRSLDDERLKRVKQYEGTYSEKQVALILVQQKILTLSKEVADLDVQIKTSLPNDKKNLETTKQQIESVKAAVLKAIDPNRPFILPKEVYGQISFQLQKMNTAESGMAQKILASRIPPPGMPPMDPKSYKSPMEVMDTVIALLRHQQMEVMARFGKDSPEDKKATDALENAYRHRAGMIYIRPSSAYLRTSFPSTSLQDDPNLAWDNMLLKQGLRNLPFSSELRDILDPSVKQDRTLTSELDKQYWQNINRVRVSGAGFTNQALVKDDVGNWYVKHYFGDTEDIAKSAKNLALFSLGSKVAIDLPRALRDASASEAELKKNPNTPTLQKVLEKHQGVYKTHTDEVKAELGRLHDKELEETLIAAWDAHKDLKEDVNFHAALQQALRAEIGVWNKAAIAVKEKGEQDPGQAIVKDVGALSRLGRMLSASIEKISSSIPSSAITQEEKELVEKEKELAGELDKEKLAAKKGELEVGKKKLDEKKKTQLEEKRNMAVFEVRKVVGGQVMGILTERNRVLGQYEQAIVFIGDAAKPEETKAK